MLDQFLISFDFSQGTRDRYSRILKLFLGDFADPVSTGPGDLLAWLDAHPGWGASSRLLALSAVKSFLRWRFGAGHPALQLRLKKRKPAIQRSLDADQVLVLLSSFDTSKAIGRRDLAMASLFLDSGLRVSELARLDIRRVDLDRFVFQVVVKGGNWASGVFSEYTASLVAGWLSDRDLICAPMVCSLFVNIRTGEQLTRGGIGRIVSSWGVKSGIGALSPHDFRRSFATLSTRRGVPARVLMEAGRWRSPSMIERYTRSINQEDFRRFFPVPGVMGIE